MFCDTKIEGFLVMFSSKINILLLSDQWIKTNGVEQLLPGLDYSPRQLFWISAANVWCSKVIIQL